jgi:hypothetical protein
LEHSPCPPPPHSRGLSHDQSKSNFWDSNPAVCVEACGKGTDWRSGRCWWLEPDSSNMTQGYASFTFCNVVQGYPNFGASCNCDELVTRIVASELYRPSDRRLLVKLVPTFADRGCHVGSVTDPYGHKLGFLNQSPYFFFQVAPQLYSRG